MERLAGSQLGAYEIVAPLGAGGMGEVYRAKDPRLKREVAIKILSQETFVDAERQKRFQREAQAASSLNHPNILVVYDIGEENGRSYIVSNLLRGSRCESSFREGRFPGESYWTLLCKLPMAFQPRIRRGLFTAI